MCSILFQDRPELARYIFGCTFRYSKKRSKYRESILHDFYDLQELISDLILDEWRRLVVLSCLCLAVSFVSSTCVGALVVLSSRLMVWKLLTCN